MSSSSTHSIYFSYLFTLSIPMHSQKDLQLILIQCSMELVCNYRMILDRHWLMVLVHRLSNLHLQERLLYSEEYCCANVYLRPFALFPAKYEFI